MAIKALLKHLPLVFACCFIFFGSVSCTTDTSNIKFDSELWKNDLSGCKGSRKELKPQVEEIRLQLIGLKEHAIRSLLGKPDTEELLQKSNKIYIYYINPGPKCANPSGAGDVAALAVRIDALGTVIESNILEE